MYKSLFFAVGFLAMACFGSSEILETGSGLVNKNISQGLLLVNNQLSPPQSIQSLQLYRASNESNPPIINLNKNETLVLEFDELTSLPGQFRLKFEHYNQHWEPSNIPEVWFIDGINELVITGGERNAFSKPGYFHYKYEFPNRELSFITSGNYMVHVYDYVSNTKLFSLPFFVTEQQGKLISSVETVFNSGSNSPAVDQLFSVYEYPKNIKFPQFDLGFEFVQNRFWGSSRSTETFDITTPGKIRFYTPRKSSFAASFDFIPLDLTELNINLTKIEDWQPEYTPPRIILKPDLLNFSAKPTQRNAFNFGQPEKERDSRYTEVTFRLNAKPNNIRNSEVFVAGDFNSWLLSRGSRLAYDPKTEEWITSLLLKEGVYRYKYFLKPELGNKSEIVPVNDSISSVKQQYTVFVYYTDPVKNYQRLLISGSF